jgi:carbamoyl-phosphate synthase large subunit
MIAQGGHPKPLTVLLSSAGRRVGLARALRQSGEALGIDVRIVACDLDPDASAACRLADARYRVPPAKDPGFVPTVLDIVRAEGVAFVVPTIDTELLAYANTRDAFEAAGAWVNVADPHSINACRDKAATASTLGLHGVPVPRTIDLETAHEEWGPAATTDVVVKPRSGSAGHLVAYVAKRAPLPAVGSEPMIVQERLEGPEYTINVFVDRAGALRCAVPHRRLAVRSGEVEKGRTVRDTRLADLAQRSTEALPGLKGVFCFQVIDDRRRGPVVFEINARFGGGYPLAHAAGAEFTRWLLEERLGRVTTAHDRWQDGMVMLRYDDAVFLPPDNST